MDPAHELYKRARSKQRLKIWLVYISVISLGLMCIAVMGSTAKNPAGLITGEWKELSWEYEKVNKADTERVHYKEISDEVKELMDEKLVIHTSETWQFLPNGKLKLHTAKGHKTLSWKLNGRGNLLEIKDEKAKESYNISELNDTLLVINFDTDLEVRGIAKLTFIKNKKRK
jgi:hypothetical protein